MELATFFFASFAAGAINSVAGGGTFLTFPVFILNGLTPLAANIMSTIALWPGNLASVYGYREIWRKDRAFLKPFLTVGITGGAVGAMLLLHTPEITFQRLVPWLMLAAMLVFTFGKRLIALMHRVRPPKGERKIAGLALQMMIAIYGGYFGAGIGILTLAMLQLMGGEHMHEMNAQKTVLTSAINLATVIIFILSGKVIWSLAVVMIAGAVSGGYLGARAALKVAPEKLRWLVIVIGFTMTAYFFIKG